MREALREISSRVMMMFSRGVLRGVDDSGPRQRVQVELLKDELRDGLEHMQNYGFTSHPKGGDVAVAFLGGNREQGIVLVVDDRQYRLKLQPGEVAIYDDLGNKIELLRDMVKVTAMQKIQIDAPEGEFNIDTLDINGSDLRHNGKNIGSTHQHDGVLPGGSNTGEPV
ncbi:phage baseplate assembly protein V [Pseudomonas silesiensis]|uniref:phage baseplate assembly protein V n=1 Tax=Pseudomonas silesiensis TaxID=1853130 RepID=UPI0030D886FD